jgi:hypothetical protein
MLQQTLQPILNMISGSSYKKSFPSSPTPIYSVYNLKVPFHGQEPTRKLTVLSKLDEPEQYWQGQAI